MFSSKHNTTNTAQETTMANKNTLYVVAETTTATSYGKTRTWNSFFSFITADSFGWATDRASAARFTKVEALRAAAAVEATIVARGYAPKGVKVFPASGGPAVNRRSKRHQALAA